MEGGIGVGRRYRRGQIGERWHWNYGIWECVTVGTTGEEKKVGLEKKESGKV